MNLGFDLDEVIGQTAQMAINHMNDVFQCNFSTDILKSFYFDENEFSDDPDEQQAVVDTLLNAVFNRELMATVEPYPEAVKILNKLKHQGHKIFIITKRPTSDEEMTVNWLHTHNIPYDRLALTQHEGKGVAAKKFKLDFFVDDLEDNLYELYSSQARWSKGLFLMTRPWNRDNYIDTTRITRLDDWNDILKAVSIGNRLRA